MLPLSFPPHLPGGRAPRVLCLGAHSDDIEIGCAGTLMEWTLAHPDSQVHCVVMSGDAQREQEARHSLERLLPGRHPPAMFGGFPDGQLPAHFVAVKEFLMSARTRFDPDIVFTHRLEDRHQDHRLLAELTWQVWRDHLILEYEIPKYEGDLGQPNIFVALSEEVAVRKLRHLDSHFASQRSKSWFNEGVFKSMMTIRGMECRATSGMAEAFHMRKALLGVSR